MLHGKEGRNHLTRFPTESRNVVGLEGEGYEKFKVGPSCSTPHCTRLTDHAHHLFSRALMGGPFDWVRLPDGEEIGNLVPLCYRHHNNVTDNQVHITYEKGQFLWEGEPLSWQPPKKGFASLVTTQLVDGSLDPESDGRPELPDRPERPICDGCGRLLPRPKIETPPEDRKTRKTWAVSVPYTVQEDGADTLDALLEASRDEMEKAGLDWGEGHKVKFNILATVLALFVQNAQAILSNVPVSATDTGE